jgi:hypothetical protein
VVHTPTETRFFGLKLLVRLCKSLRYSPRAETGQEPEQTKTHLCVELKKKGGDPLHKALTQLVGAIHQLGESAQDYEVFSIIQRGMKIGFLEYYSFAADDLKDLDNYKGCVPLTYLSEDLIFESDQAKDTLQNLVRHLPAKMQDLGKGSLHTQCVFDLEFHKEEINILFLKQRKNRSRM